MKPTTTTRILTCGLLVAAAGVACSAPADLAVTPDPLAAPVPSASVAPLTAPVALDAPSPVPSASVASLTNASGSPKALDAPASVAPSPVSDLSSSDASPVLEAPDSPPVSVTPVALSLEAPGTPDAPVAPLLAPPVSVAPDASDGPDEPDVPDGLAAHVPDAQDGPEVPVAPSPDGPDEPDVPDGPVALPAPVAPETLAAIVECDVVPLGELAESGTVRFVADGDVDRGDGGGCGMVPSVRLAVVNGYNDILGWWRLVGADLGIGGGLAPPGLQIPSSDERLSAAPARFLTTGPGGTAEAFIGNVGWYTVCAMSPVVQDLIAGCSHEPIWLSFGSEVYVFFSHGHAIVETGPEAAERYQRFLNGADISNQPRVSVFFLSTYLYFPDSPIYLPLPNYGFDIPNDGFNFTFLDTNVQVAVIEDAYVDAWWSDASPLDMYGGTFHFDPGVLENEWVYVISTGYDGLVEVALPPGDYLFCHVLVRSEVYGRSLGCDHEDVPDSNGRVVVIEKGGSLGEPPERGIVFNSVNMEPEDSGRELLEWAKTAPFEP